MYYVCLYESDVGQPAFAVPATSGVVRTNQFGDRWLVLNAPLPDGTLFLIVIDGPLSADAANATLAILHQM